MKVLEVIKKIFAVLFTIIFFAYAMTMTILLLNFNDYGVTVFGSTSLVLIKDDISSDTYEKGDLVIVESKRLEKYEKGEEIFVYKLDSKGAAHIEVGKLGNIYLTEEAVAFENGDTYSAEYLIGAGEERYENIGSILGVIESKWGFLFTVLLPCFLFFIYQLYALIIEIKYGTEED